MHIRQLLFAVALAPILLTAQDAPANPHRQVVRASGTAVLSVKPDQARISIGVTTQAPRAQDAVKENAERTAAVLKQLKTLVGSNGEIQTTNYSVSPQYRYPKDGGTPTVTGYSANNMVEVIVNDLALVGKLIDESTQSGANTINSIGFTLRDESAVSSQVIAQAAKKARANAEAIATALGMRVVGVAEAETVDFAPPVRPVYNMAAMARNAAPTPVEAGALDVSARVIVALEVAQ